MPRCVDARRELSSVRLGDSGSIYQMAAFSRSAQSSRWRREGRVAQSGRKMAAEHSSRAAWRCSRLPWQRADAHEREALAMRTAQVPLRPLRRWSGDEDRFLQQRLDLHAAHLGRGMHPAEVAHAVLTGRWHVLQIAPQELLGAERATLPLLRLRVGIVEHHAFLIGHDDALVADRRAADVAREVTGERMGSGFVVCGYGAGAVLGRRAGIEAVFGARSRSLPAAAVPRRPKMTARAWLNDWSTPRSASVPLPTRRELRAAIGPAPASRRGNRAARRRGSRRGVARVP